MLHCIFFYYAGLFHVCFDEKSVDILLDFFFLRHILTTYLLLRILRSKFHAESKSLKGDFKILAHEYEDCMNMQIA